MKSFAGGAINGRRHFNGEFFSLREWIKIVLFNTPEH